MLNFKLRVMGSVEVMTLPFPRAHCAADAKLSTSQSSCFIILSTTLMLRGRNLKPGVGLMPSLMRLISRGLDAQNLSPAGAQALVGVRKRAPGETQTVVQPPSGQKEQFCGRGGGGQGEGRYGWGPAVVLVGMGARRDVLGRETWRCWALVLLA